MEFMFDYDYAVAIRSNGNIDRESIQNQPFKYNTAIYFLSTISVQVLSSLTEVKKVTMMSRRKQPSIDK